MLRIRVANLADAGALAELNTAVQTLHAARHPEQFKHTAPAEVSAWFRDRLNEPHTVVWLAEDDSLPVGYVVATIRQAQESPFCFARRWCELDQIAVQRSHRGAGIGRALVHEVIEHARVVGSSEIQLTSWCFNQVAQRFFTRCGFRPKSTRFELSLRPV